MRRNLHERFAIDMSAHSFADRIAETLSGIRSNVEEAAAASASVRGLAAEILSYDPSFKAGAIVSRSALQRLTEAQNFLNQFLMNEYENTRKAKKRFLNDVEIANSNTSSLFRKVGQRSSLLKSLSGEARDILKESFLSLENIESGTAANEMTIFQNQGVATLPVIREENIRIKTLGIGSGSNGVNGNGDDSITPSLGYLSSITDEDPDNWFEYESLGAGPLRFNLDVIFEKEEILNYLKIGFVLPGDARSFVVHDIVFNDKDGGLVSIKDIFVKKPGKDFWKAARNDGSSEWDITFLPIETKRFTVMLVQRDSYTVVRNSILKRRYAIGIKSIEIKKLSFASTGTLKSTEQRLGPYLFRMETTINAFPESLFNYRLLTKAGDIKSRQEEKYLATPINGESGTIEWNLNVTREDARISRASSILPEEEAYELNSVTRPVHSGHSPAVIPLREDLEDSKIFVIQPRVMKIGENGIRLTIMDDSRVFPLPFSLSDKDMSPSKLIVKIEDEEYEYVSDKTMLVGNSWTLNKQGDKVIVSEDWSGWGQVDIAALPELLNFELTSKGFEARFNYLFDPEKYAINVDVTTSLNSLFTKNIDKNGRSHFLGHRYINLDTFNLSSALGVVMVRVDDLSDVVDATKYHVDSGSGILTLYQASGSDTFTAQFQASPRRPLANKNYEIFFDEEKPAGILIAPEALNIFTIEETIGDDLLFRSNPITGDWEQTTVSGGSGRKLSYESIIKGTLTVRRNLITGQENPKEIPFIDGIKEFYGAINTVERTNRIAPTAGIVQFSLSAGAKTIIDTGFGFSFSTDSYFLNRKGTLGGVVSDGDYHISAAGVVTLKTSTFLPADLLISYYYRDPEFIGDNKYSVDYADGVLYSQESLNEDSRISYAVCPSLARYFMAKEIEDFSYNAERNTIEFPTEQMTYQADRSSVKIFWRKKKGTGNAERMKDYFSPIFESITYRFF